MISRCPRPDSIFVDMTDLSLHSAPGSVSPADPPPVRRRVLYVAMLLLLVWAGGRAGLFGYMPGTPLSLPAPGTPLAPEALVALWAGMLGALVRGRIEMSWIVLALAVAPPVATLVPAEIWRENNAAFRGGLGLAALGSLFMITRPRWRRLDLAVLVMAQWAVLAIHLIYQVAVIVPIADEVRRDYAQTRAAVTRMTPGELDHAMRAAGALQAPVSPGDLAAIAPAGWESAARATLLAALETARRSDGSGGDVSAHLVSVPDSAVRVLVVHDTRTPGRAAAGDGATQRAWIMNPPAPRAWMEAAARGVDLMVYIGGVLWTILVLLVAHMHGARVERIAPAAAWRRGWGR